MTSKVNDNDVAWYVVNTYAGQENRVKENLLKRISTMGLEDSLFDVVVAEETEVEYKNGKGNYKDAQSLLRLYSRAHAHDPTKPGTLSATPRA